MVVRSVGLVGFLLLCALGPLTFWLTAPVQTKAVRPLPAAEWPSLRDGSWFEALGAHAEATSALAYHLRGLYVETAYELGVLDHDRVALRADEWMFDRPAMRANPQLFQRLEPHRRRHFAAVADAARQLGVSVVFLVAPDKSTIYPDRAWGLEVPPPERTEALDRLLGEAADAGLVVVDARPGLLAMRRAGREAYQARDTHWLPEGAMSAAEAVGVELLRRGVTVDAARMLSAEFATASPVPTRPDLVELLGMRLDVPLNHWSPYAVVRRLQELLPQGIVRVRGAAGPERTVRYDDPDAVVALAGTSFSGWLAPAIVFQLRVEPNTEGVRSGTGPIEQIYPVLARVRAGELRPEIVVWEITERLRNHLGWEAPVPDVGRGR